MTNKTKTSFRLSEKALKLLRLLAEKNGLSMTGILELAIRYFAEKQDVEARSD